MTPAAGFLGLWVSKSAAKVRNIYFQNLEDFSHQLASREGEAKSQSRALKDDERYLQLLRIRKTRAVKVIQNRFKEKRKFTAARMACFRQAEDTGCADQMRTNNVMMWLAVFAILNRFEVTLHQKEIWEKKTRRYLEWLDETSPPLPPPPPEAPPLDIDEGLHYRYQLRRREYAHQWETAGHTVLGKEKFERIKNMDDGPAKVEKKLVAKRWLEKAMQVTSEKEHQECLRRAWCLENDWASMDDPNLDPNEINKWAAARLAKESALARRT